MEIINKNINEVHPLPNNPKKHTRKQIQEIANSIKEYGWTVPIVCNHDLTVIAGNGRLKAAKLLKLETVPVVIVEFNGKENKYAIEDNLLNMLTGWDNRELKFCIESLNSETICGLDPSSLLRENHFNQKYVNFKRSLSIVDRGLGYTCITATNSTLIFGDKELHEMKEDFSNVEFFVDTTSEIISETMGGKLSDTCIIPAPAGRHTERNFAYETAKGISEKLGMPYRQCLQKNGKAKWGHIKTTITETPPESLCILYDDIITTGYSMKASRDALLGAGKNGLCFAGVKNG